MNVSDLLCFDDLQQQLLQLNPNFPLVLMAIFNIILAITATFGNGLIIFTILKSQNLQTPSYLLITSLAFTDLCIGIVYHPYLAFLSVLYYQKNHELACSIRRFLEVFFVLSFALTGATTLMNTTISIDRYLALSLRHRYRIHVTKKRVGIVTTVVWAVTILGAITISLSVLTEDEALVMFILAFTSVIINCVFYILSFIILHRYTSQVQVQQPNPSHGNFDVVKYRKTLKTMMIVLSCFLSCCLPFGIFVVTEKFDREYKYRPLAGMVSMLILGGNSSINPVIYLTKFTDIRKEFKNLLKKLKLC